MTTNEELIEDLANDLIAKISNDNERCCRDEEGVRVTIRVRIQPILDRVHEQAREEGYRAAIEDMNEDRAYKKGEI
jgi:hypothetical protein